jgi:hypothetical protein
MKYFLLSSSYKKLYSGLNMVLHTSATWAVETGGLQFKANLGKGHMRTSLKNKLKAKSDRMLV